MRHGGDWQYNSSMNWRRIVRISFRYLLPLAVIALVGWYFYEILRQPELREVSFACRVEYLAPAAFLYLIAHTIWASFWWSLLHSQGYPATYGSAVRAYFISQYGKYIPGKVWVIVIRMVMLGASPKDKAVVGLTATYEALTSMAAGAIIGAILIPLMNIDLKELKFYVPQEYILFGVAFVPIGMGLLHRLSVRIARRRRGRDAVTIKMMNMLLLFRGLLQASVGWLLLGFSLWMTMQAIRPEPVAFSWNDYWRLTAINGLAYVFGFVAFFMPGGAGAREYVLAILLAAELVLAGLATPIAGGLAVVVALVLRLIWTIAEVVMAVALYRYVRGHKSADAEISLSSSPSSDPTCSEPLK
jgi:glycosyltransferase 2 family protein